MQDITLQKFLRFKGMFISSNIPNDLLLELLENYITSDDKDVTAEDIPVLDGQLSLLDST